MPGDLKLKIDAPNLQELTAFLPLHHRQPAATQYDQTDNSIAHLG